MKKEAIRVSTAIPVAPTTLYFAWLDSAQHGAMTSKTAKIEPTVGAKFSAADGYISGKLVTLDLGRRIIMSWRTTDFPRDAHDSRVEMHFEGLGAGTRVTVLHTELPEGQGEKVRALWMDTYFSPMRNHFSKYLPDPRNEPPRRQPPPPMEEDEEPDMDDIRARSKAKIALRGKSLPMPVKPSKGPSVAKAAPSRPSLPTKGTKPTKTPAPVAAPKAAAPPAKPTKAAKPAPKPVKAPAKPAPAAKKAGKPSPKPVAKKAAKPAPKPVAKKAAKPAKKPAKPAKKKR